MNFKLPHYRTVQHDLARTVRIRHDRHDCDDQLLCRFENCIRNQLKTKITNHSWFLLSSFLTISTTRNTKKQIKYKKQILQNNNYGSIQKASTFIGSCHNFLWFSRRNRFSNSNAYLARSWHTDRNAYLARS